MSTPATPNRQKVTNGSGKSNNSTSNNNNNNSNTTTSSSSSSSLLHHNHTTSSKSTDNTPQRRKVQQHNQQQQQQQQPERPRSTGHTIQQQPNDNYNWQQQELLQQQEQHQYPFPNDFFSNNIRSNQHQLNNNNNNNNNNNRSPKPYHHHYQQRNNNNSNNNESSSSSSRSPKPHQHKQQQQRTHSKSPPPGYIRGGGGKSPNLYNNNNNKQQQNHHRNANSRSPIPSQRNNNNNNNNEMNNLTASSSPYYYQQLRVGTAVVDGGVDGTSTNTNTPAPTVITPADLTVLITRTDLYDIGIVEQQQLQQQQQQQAAACNNNNNNNVETDSSLLLLLSSSPSGTMNYNNNFFTNLTTGSSPRSIPPPPNTLTNTPLQPYYHHHQQQHQQQPVPEIAEYSWHRPSKDTLSSNDNNSNDVVDNNNNNTVYICRVPPCPLPNLQPNLSLNNNNNNNNNNVESTEKDNNTNNNDNKSTPSLSLLSSSSSPPISLNPELTKYWIQRHRLFSKFDYGIELDDEGWFIVTPEIIANHVAARMIELIRYNNSNNNNNENKNIDTSTSANKNNDNENNITTANQNSCNRQKIIVLDAFGGCGGNAIAFAKLSDDVEQVICVDIDRKKLQRAANNAAIYDIPCNKIVFVECNVLFILQHCYRDGQFVLDQPLSTPEAAMALMEEMPPPVITEIYKHFQIGGIDLLPRKIDIVFMDPPWGGVDYAIFGKNGYDLQKNMRIQRPIRTSTSTTDNQNDPGCDLNGFFDTFHTFASGGAGSNNARNKQERKANFNCGLDESNCVNGAELLAAAAMASAAPQRAVIYDIPRNTSRMSIGQSALFAGYRGNIKVEEHYLNGRLKTITAYFGCDWRNSLLPLQPPPSSSDADTDGTLSNTETTTRNIEQLAELMQNQMTDDTCLEDNGVHRTSHDDDDTPHQHQRQTVFLPFLPSTKK